jgi:hypothetical protein
MVQNHGLGIPCIIVPDHVYFHNARLLQYGTPSCGVPVNDRCVWRIAHYLLLATEQI